MLKVRVSFKDGAEVTREFPGMSWDNTRHQKLFSDVIREAEAEKGAAHAGAWMEHVTEAAG